VNLARLGRGARHAWYWTILLVIIVATVWLHGAEPAPQHIIERFTAPNASHWLGTDELGRDVIHQTIVGLSWSVEVSALATVIAVLIGTVVGLVSGWSQRWYARIILRFVDFQVAFPFVVLGVVLIGVLGRGTMQIASVLGVAIWPLVGRVAYAETLQQREQGYVVYARLVTSSSVTVIARHVLPAIWGRIAVIAAIVFGDIVGAAAALTLLGIGPPIGTPTWGNMLASGQQFLARAPWIAIGPSIALVLLVVFVNLLADRLASFTDKRTAAAAAVVETGVGEPVAAVPSSRVGQ
jgi:peptide/nickel transport system permease protein